MNSDEKLEMYQPQEGENNSELDKLQKGNEKSEIDRPQEGDNNSEMDQSRETAIKKAVRKERWKVICLMAALLIFAAALWCLFSGFFRGTQAVKRAFDVEKAKAEEAVYSSFYEQGFTAAEKDYHVKNRAVISLKNIRETANLEVLSVSDIAFMIENPDSENKNILSWIEVPGTGVFTVNLAAGEFLVDDERMLVFARIPKPELLPENINIDHANVQVLRFSSNALRSSIRDGEHLAGKQLNEARTKIQEDISTNLQYYEFAENSARTLIENLIRSINSEIPELKVEIEFF